MSTHPIPAIVAAELELGECEVCRRNSAAGVVDLTPTRTYHHPETGETWEVCYPHYREWRAEDLKAAKEELNCYDEDES